MLNCSALLLTEAFLQQPGQPSRKLAFQPEGIKEAEHLTPTPPATQGLLHCHPQPQRRTQPPAERGQGRGPAALSPYTHRHVDLLGDTCVLERTGASARMFRPSAVCLPKHYYSFLFLMCFFFIFKSCFQIGNTCKWCFNSTCRQLRS